MTDAFIINYIDKKIGESKDINCIKYSFYELKIKNNLSDEEIERFLSINKNYFENNGYKVFFTGEKFVYNKINMCVKNNELMIAVKN